MEKNRTPDLRPLPDPPYRRPLRGQVVAAGTLQPPYERGACVFRKSTAGRPTSRRRCSHRHSASWNRTGCCRARSTPRYRPAWNMRSRPAASRSCPPHSAYRVGRGKFRRHPRRPGAGKDIATARACPANQADTCGQPPVVSRQQNVVSRQQNKDAPTTSNGKRPSAEPGALQARQREPAPPRECARKGIGWRQRDRHPAHTLNKKSPFRDFSYFTFS